MNQPLTEAQELEALQKIKEIVAELGPYSYLAFTFAGVWELAEENIRNDLYRNPVDHANELKARLAEERDEYKAQAAFEAIKRDFEQPEVREDYERWKAAKAAAQKNT